VGGVQFTLVHVARMTQSPLGRQPVGNSLNRFQPGGQPKIPQLIAFSQFCVGSANPLVSVAGKALLVDGGAVKHGLAVWLLCFTMRYAIENALLALALM